MAYKASGMATRPQNGEALMGVGAASSPFLCWARDIFVQEAAGCPPCGCPGDTAVRALLMWRPVGTAGTQRAGPGAPLLLWAAAGSRGDGIRVTSLGRSFGNVCLIQATSRSSRPGRCAFSPGRHPVCFCHSPFNTLLLFSLSSNRATREQKFCVSHVPPPRTSIRQAALHYICWRHKWM